MGENFGFMLHSPLERSKKTAEIIMDHHSCPYMELPQLREIDLYSMQGLLKHEGKEKFGPIYTDWQKRPHELMIDNHAPVRFEKLVLFVQKGLGLLGSYGIEGH